MTIKRNKKIILSLLLLATRSNVKAEDTSLLALERDYKKMKVTCGKIKKVFNKKYRKSVDLAWVEYEDIYLEFKGGGQVTEEQVFEKYELCSKEANLLASEEARKVYIEAEKYYNEVEGLEPRTEKCKAVIDL